MIFYLVLILIIASFAAFPYVRMLIKRVVLLHELKSICTEKKYILHDSHRNWIFDGIDDSYAGFYVECPKKVYSVKLLGTKSRLQFINFIDPSNYSIRKYYGHFRGIIGGVSYWEDIARKKKPYDFTYNLPEGCSSKELMPIVLICPVPAKVSAMRGNTRVDLCDGDHTGEGYLYTRRGFLELLFDDDSDNNKATPSQL